MKLTRTQDAEIPPEDMTVGIEEQPEQSSTEPEVTTATESGHQCAGYVEDAWANYTNYQCTLCPYSTLSREAIEQHVAWHRATRQVHDWRPPTS
jgi:hypothetical protein